MFVSENSNVGTSLMEFAYLLCSELKTLFLNLSKEDKAGFSLGQLRNSVQTLAQPPDDMNFSPSGENQILFRTTLRLFVRLIEDLEGHTGL